MSSRAAPVMLAEPPPLELQHISHHFGSLQVLEDISLNIPAGQFVCLIGASGSGKSTLLNIVAGLLEPSKGQVLLAGQPVQRGQAGYMPQRDALLPWRTVVDNALLGVEIRHKNQRDTMRQARTLLEERLEQFGLANAAQQKPHELSGGMQQRVALLRAIMYEDKLLLLDEPLSALDALLRFKVQQWLARMVAQLNSTMLMITHDIREALLLADRIIVLGGAPARVRLDVPVPRQQAVRSLADLQTPAMLKLEHTLFQELLEDAESVEKSANDEAA